MADLKLVGLIVVLFLVVAGIVIAFWFGGYVVNETKSGFQTSTTESTITTSYTLTLLGLSKTGAEFVVAPLGGIIIVVVGLIAYWHFNDRRPRGW